ncbi:hypothetical protein RSAG8_08273, partial [Rhizoctonia solani AG-8 WAC10335]
MWRLFVILGVRDPSISTRDNFCSFPVNARALDDVSLLHLKRYNDRDLTLQIDAPTEPVTCLQLPIHRTWSVSPEPHGTCKILGTIARALHSFDLSALRSSTTLACGLERLENPSPYNQMATRRTGRRISRIALDESFEEPKQVGGMVAHFTFLSLGVSSLLPWNALIIALPFFLTKLEGTELHDTFASWISFLFNGVGLLSIGLAAWLGGRSIGPLTCTFSMAALTLLFGFLTIIPFFELPTTAFFLMIMSASVMLAVAGGLLQTATITLAPAYGPSAIAYYMAGSALSAVGVSRGDEKLDGA